MPSLTLNSTLASPLYTGQATSNLVPKPFDVAIGGRAYIADLSFKPWKRQAFRFTSVDQLRAQADTSNVPGEASLNPNGLWRRTQDSWHHGAGQVHLDRKVSDIYRFRSSKGVSVWTQWQATLLNNTAQVRASANTNLALATTALHQYLCDGNEVYWTATLAGGSTAWTAATIQNGESALSVQSICSDGFNVYAALGANGIHTTVDGATTSTHYNDLQATLVRFVMGRLMAAKGAAIYNVTASGAAPAALFTSNYPNFTWVDFAEGQSVIYAAGFSGDQSIVYRIGITSDGTALSAPVVAATLPRGEVVNTIFGYAGGQIAIGSNLGWRFAEAANTNGDLTVGPLVGSTVGSATAVKCFAGYDRFIWYGWTNYDAASTGLGCMDPSVFPDQTLVPAWASDLMATAQGTVTSIKLFGGTPVFAVAGGGFYQKTSTYVPSGTIDSGLITYDIVDNKVPVFVDVEQAVTASSTVTTYVSADGGAFNTIGSTNTGDTFTELPCLQSLAHTIEIRETLNLAGGVSPVLTRHTLRAIPAAVTPTDIFCVIRLDVETLTRAGQEHNQNMWNEFAYLDGLRTQKKVVPFQAGSYSTSVTVESIDLIPEAIARDRKTWGGVAVLTLRSVV